jgi:hypothetical protein
VPPADSKTEPAQLSADESAVEAREDLNIVITWASAKLFGRSFDLPAGRIGQWLRALTVEDAGLIAAANGAGALADHLAGKRQFAGLAPVDGFEQTQRWLLDRRPGPTHCELPNAAEHVVSPEFDSEQDGYALRFSA